MFCGKCGTRIPDEDKFCYKCGGAATVVIGSGESATQVEHQRVSSFERPVHADSQSRVVYVLLGLFLGGFGIHNFYAGYGGRGITQLLLWVFGWSVFVTWVILGLWILVELFTVERGANGVPFR